MLNSISTPESFISSLADLCERFVCGTVGLFSLLINSIIIRIDIHTCPELQTSSSSRSVLQVILSQGVLRDLAYSVCTEN